MLTYFTIILSATFAFSMIMSSTPLSLGLWVLFLSLMIAVLFCLISFNWISFLIFLIYVGGLLVMFAYFSAIQPNNHFEMTKMMSLFTFTFFSLDFPFNSLSMTPLSLNLMNNMSLSSIYNPQNMPAILVMVIILSMALVAVVKISKSVKGPLRPFL
uniref:NADH dehydrogenase subunit 6 n=1 Tax=Glyphohesione klatti TaxID=3053539 RepID=UPI0030DE94A5